MGRCTEIWSMYIFYLHSLHTMLVLHSLIANTGLLLQI